MSHDPIAARDAELQTSAGVDDDLERLSRGWARLDAYEPGLRALVEGAFSHAKFRAERMPTQRVATAAGVATIIAYAARRGDLARPLEYRLVGTLTWEPSEGLDDRIGLVWNEETLQYGDVERHVSFPASIEVDGTFAVNVEAFAHAVVVAMG